MYRKSIIDRIDVLQNFILHLVSKRKKINKSSVKIFINYTWSPLVVVEW